MECDRSDFGFVTEQLQCRVERAGRWLGIVIENEHDIGIKEINAEVKCVYAEVVLKTDNAYSGELSLSTGGCVIGRGIINDDDGSIFECGVFVQGAECVAESFGTVVAEEDDAKGEAIGLRWFLERGARWGESCEVV